MPVQSSLKLSPSSKATHRIPPSLLPQTPHRPTPRPSTTPALQISIDLGAHRKLPANTYIPIYTYLPTCLQVHTPHRRPNHRCTRSRLSHRIYHARATLSTSRGEHPPRSCRGGTEKVEVAEGREPLNLCALPLCEKRGEPLLLLP